jgi:small subunit ribosomal protein S4e
MIVMRRLVQVDQKVRTDLNFPAGFQDVVQIPKTDEVFRLLYDVKGRFVLHRITKEEAAYKLCRVQKVARGAKASIGHNPFHQGQAGSIPYLVTHDGRTIRFADPAVKVHDTVKVDLATGKQIGHIKFDVGNLVMITKGNNVGRVGVLVAKERHLGSFDIVHIRDRKGNAFSTRIQNVFVIGEGNKPAISLPKGKGIKQTILEEQAARISGDKGKKE